MGSNQQRMRGRRYMRSLSDTPRSWPGRGRRNPVRARPRARPPCGHGTRPALAWARRGRDGNDSAGEFLGW